MTSRSRRPSGPTTGWRSAGRSAAGATRPLVFLHGWCGDREYWKHQVGAFAADYRIVALDQAGHGESGQERNVWKAASLAGAVEAVVKELGLKRVILVGHSMGGQIALLAAKR